MRKELKEKITHAYESETPEIKERVLEACENEYQLPKAEKAGRARRVLRAAVAAAMSAVLFVVGIAVGRLGVKTPPAPEQGFAVYLDVNPSVELVLDKDERVMAFEALNEDAELVTAEMELIGVTFKTALNAVIGGMYAKGYLTSEENSVLISVAGGDETAAKAFLSYATEQVNGVFSQSEMECSIIAQRVTGNEELCERAKEQGVSVGKLHFVDKVVRAHEELSEKDVTSLLGLSIRELNLLYAQDGGGKGEENDDLISGSLSGIVDKASALAAVLLQLQVEESGVEWYEVDARLSMVGGFGLVYSVRIKLKGSDTEYHFEVDCKTGKVSLWQDEDKGDEHGGHGGVPSEKP